MGPITFRGMTLKTIQTPAKANPSQGKRVSRNRTRIQGIQAYSRYIKPNKAKNCFKSRPETRIQSSKIPTNQAHAYQEV